MLAACVNCADRLIPLLEECDRVRVEELKHIITELRVWNTKTPHAVTIPIVGFISSVFTLARFHGPRLDWWKNTLSRLTREREEVSEA